MTDCQKLLKQRKLPDGYYYCRTRAGNSAIHCIVANYLPPELFTEVIAPVPTYEECEEYVFKTRKTIDGLRKEIIQLHMENLKRKYK